MNSFVSKSLRLSGIVYWLNNIAIRMPVNFHIDLHCPDFPQYNVILSQLIITPVAPFTNTELL